MAGKDLFRDIAIPLQLLILCVLSLSSVIIAIALGGGLVLWIWDINIFTHPGALQALDAVSVLHANRLLLFFQHLGLFVVPALLFAYLSQRAWLKAMGLKKKTTLQVMMLTALLMLAIQPLVGWVGEWNAGMTFPASMEALENYLKEMEESAGRLTEALLLSPDAGILFINVLLLALIPALGEEMIFRGTIQRLLGVWWKKPHLAIWFTAFLFSFLHFQFFGFLPRFLLGALLGYLFWWSGSLWVPVLAHFVNNALGVVLFFLAARDVIPVEWVNEETAVPAMWLVWLALPLTALLLAGVKKKARETRAAADFQHDQSIRSVDA